MAIEAAAERTTEHVLPRSFYEGRVVPENSLTLPAHLACNKSTESDEQLVFVALGQTTVSPTHTPELKARSNRSLQRDRALAADLLSQVVRGPGEKSFVSPDQERMTRVMAKVVKGLLFREAAILLGSEWRWTVRAPDSDALIPPAPATWIVAVPPDGPARGTTLSAKGFDTGERMFVWDLLLNRAHRVLVFATHRDLDVGRGATAFDLVDLVWPLKRKAAGRVQ